MGGYYIITWKILMNKDTEILCYIVESIVDYEGVDTNVFTSYELAKKFYDEEAYGDEKVLIAVEIDAMDKIFGCKKTILEQERMEEWA